MRDTSNSMVPSDTVILWLGNAETLREPTSVPEFFTRQEKERLNSFRFDELRRFYAKVHHSFRIQVAELLGMRASDIQIRYRGCPQCGSPRHGPPYLETAWGNLHFTLSKSAPFFAFGIASFPLGVDLEERNRLRDDSLISPLVFCEEELQLLKGRADRSLALKWWVRKEALLKAYGSGLCDAPSGINVSREIHPGCCIVEHRDTEWTVQDIDLPGHPLESSLAFAHRTTSPEIKLVSF